MSVVSCDEGSNKYLTHQSSDYKILRANKTWVDKMICNNGLLCGMNFPL